MTDSTFLPDWVTALAADVGLAPATLLLALAALAALALLGLVLWASGRRRAQAERLGARLDGLADTVASLAQGQGHLTGSLKQLSDHQAATQAQLMRTLEMRLDQVSQRMGASLNETATKTAGSLSELKTRLQVIDAAQKNIEKLSTEVVGLQDILANKQARGAFGEVQLNDIVTSALPPSAYSFQTTLGNGKRADCMLLLPNPPGPIAVDAKFPLDSFQALRAASTDAEKREAARAFRTDVQTHVKAISERYILPGETADSALMFLPSEAVYAELHASFPDVVRKSYEARVWIVSPTTLMATLNTVRAILKDVHMREQAGAIQREIGLLFADVDRLQKRVDNLKGHFGQAEKDIREIEISSDKIVRRVTKIEEFDLGDAPEAQGTVPKAAAGNLFGRG
ncbi:DNA recombination protein RmuC [Futiania mangrovi]|uniref:DNA recombination protein RmuC homolog n=1 Tax=Futiania mangrovi TaxID=2959716 RepID=A0A9J6PEB5_9PROT|nr:DNA recombination protein RmuC [Futiania mangrovii]MCP1337757.1 DNA recombination protein RmuC [Futiania mangrovii]